MVCSKKTHLTNSSNIWVQLWPSGYSVGLVIRGCGFESRLQLELSTTEVRPLSKAPNPQLALRAQHCRLPTAPSVCTLGWVKCREHISLLVILCIIVYVTNKAHLSLICLFFCFGFFYSQIATDLSLSFHS